MRKFDVRGSVVGAAALAALTFATSAPAAQILSNPADFEARKRQTITNGTPNAPTYNDTLRSVSAQAAPELQVGFATNYGTTAGGTAGGGLNAIWYFALPKLAPGESIDAADFVSALTQEDATSNIVNPRFNAALFALGVTNALPSTTANYTARAEEYFFLGTNDPAVSAAPGGRALIDAEFFAGQSNFGADYQTVNRADGSKGPAVEFNTDGDAALTQYIKALYDAGLVPSGGSDATTYLIMRLNPDRAAGSPGYDFNNDSQPDAVGGASRFSMASAESPDTLANGDPARTYLTLAVVPEPATAAVLGLGGLMLMARRRNRG